MTTFKVVAFFAGVTFILAASGLSFAAAFPDGKLKFDESRCPGSVYPWCRTDNVGDKTPLFLFVEQKMRAGQKESSRQNFSKNFTLYVRSLRGQSFEPGLVGGLAGSARYVVLFGKKH